MIKFGVVKLGDGTLKGIKDYQGRVKWNDLEDDSAKELEKLSQQMGWGGALRRCHGESGES